MISQQFMRFMMAGGIAAIANFGSRFVFNAFVDYAVAIFLAYIVGMTTAFILMRQHVFNVHQDKPLIPQISKFIGINLLALAQTLIISLVFAHWILPALGVTQYVQTIAHFIGICVPIVSSYFGHKLFTFK